MRANGIRRSTSARNDSCPASAAANARQVRYVPRRFVSTKVEVVGRLAATRARQVRVTPGEPLGGKDRGHASPSSRRRARAGVCRAHRKGHLEHVVDTVVEQDLQVEGHDHVDPEEQLQRPSWMCRLIGPGA
jgi:hypothetical protein